MGFGAQSTDVTIIICLSAHACACVVMVVVLIGAVVLFDVAQSAIAAVAIRLIGCISVLSQVLCGIVAQQVLW